MMIRLFGAATAVLFAISAPAATVINVTLSNAQEVPPTNPTTATGAPRSSSGTATLVIDDAMTQIAYTITVNGIDFGSQTADPNDDLLNAHIHAGPLVSPTTNGAVVFGFQGLPFNEAAPNDRVYAPFASGVGGTISGVWNASEGNGTTLADQLPNILAGRAYINFHTRQFTGGELRGNISGVPEPAAWVTMIAGFGAIGTTLRLRRIASPA